MTWTSDHKNQQKKGLMGVTLLLPTFPPSWTWPFLAIFHNTEPRAILKFLWCSNNLMQKMTYVHIKLSILKYVSKILFRNVHDFQGFSLYYQRPGPFELFRPFASEVLGLAQQIQSKVTRISFFIHFVLFLLYINTKINSVLVPNGVQKLVALMHSINRNFQIVKSRPNIKVRKWLGSFLLLFFTKSRVLQCTCLTPTHQQAWRNAFKSSGDKANKGLV